MQLASIESSQVILLTQMSQADGSIYVPNAIDVVAKKYSFTKQPSVDDLAKGVLIFSFGKYKNIQINELGIYNDGLIVKSQSDTKHIDEFISELMTWAAKELKLVESPIAKPERYYESFIIVKANKNLMNAITPNPAVAKAFNNVFLKAGVVERSLEFDLTGLVLNGDQTLHKSKRLPFRFLLERRAGFSFADNVFYSQAPLPTDQHIKFLTELENIS